MLFVKLCRLSAKESRRKQKYKRNYEYKEGLASRNFIERVHISLTEKSEYVIKQVGYHSGKKRAACVKHERQNHTRKQIGQNIYKAEMKHRKEKRGKNNGADYAAFFILAAENTSEDKFLANCGDKRVCYQKINI